MEIISIHAPRAESDLAGLPHLQMEAHFNPRSPCGERLNHIAARKIPLEISIHAPRAESDLAWHIAIFERQKFQSTLPVRRATNCGRFVRFRYIISIHAPRAESDIWVLSNQRYIFDFNPRSPCGERPDMFLNQRSSFVFQSTLPVRRATRLWRFVGCLYRNFNPRSPCGERRVAIASINAYSSFQSTLPVRRATALPHLHRRTSIISIHAPRAESDIFLILKSRTI